MYNTTNLQTAYCKISEGRHTLEKHFKKGHLHFSTKDDDISVQIRNWY